MLIFAKKIHQTANPMKLNYFLNVLFVIGLFVFFAGCISLCLMCCWQLAVLIGGLVLSSMSVFLYYCLNG